MNSKTFLQTKHYTERCHLLDSIRGLTVLNMIAFHAVWDLVYIFGMQWAWYHGQGAYFWQQGICWTFILLSGFCSGMSRHPLRRGLTVFGLGAGITLITGLLMPEDLIVFGVLTLIGSCMLIMAGTRNILEKIPSYIGLVCSFLLFAMTKHITSGFIGFFQKEFFKLPSVLYQNHFTAFFGFPHKAFYSTDYFPLFPWLFLFLTGFYLYQLIGKQILQIQWKGISFLNFIGTHALEIYVLHQPVIYGILWLDFNYL